MEGKKKDVPNIHTTFVLHSLIKMKIIDIPDSRAIDLFLLREK